MKIRRAAGLWVMILSGAAWAAAIVDLDFTAAEGFSDGTDLNLIQNMNAQSAWDAGDTAGTGYAVCNGSWQRAKNFAGFTLDVGQSVVIETTLRLADADGIYTDADNFRIGLAETSLHAGDNIPSIGAVLHTDAGGNYSFGGPATESRIDVDAADAGDWIRFSQRIVRSAVPNEFICTVSATNLTGAADLGSAVSWAESTTDGSWGGIMSPGFRTLANAGATALQIDRWTVSPTNAPWLWPRIYTDTVRGPGPLTVVFDASGSQANNDIISYQWIFGDGNTATGVLATNTYTNAGSFVAELTITDSSNRTASTEVGIDVLDELRDLGVIWFIGDSITQSNADGDSGGSPRKALYDLLTANGYTFSYTGHFTANVDGLPGTGAAPADNLYHYHSGISGSVIGDDYAGRVGMTANLSSFWNSGRLAVVKPDMILILLGANDVGLALDLPGAPEQLRTLVQTLYELPGIGDPTVFLAQIAPIRISPDTPARVAAFNDAVPGIVSGFRMQGRDVRLVDMFTPINNNFALNMQPDNLHPNAAGNEVMAQQWYQAVTGGFPGVPSDFHGFELFTFQTNGLSCKVAVPDTVAAGRPWIWRARFWDHEPGPDLALLSNGFHVAYVDVAGLYGAPQALARFDAFYEFLTLSYGFDRRAVLEGMSRGGLVVFNWAAQNTDKVLCIYADAPVCDFKSWPGGYGEGAGSPSDWISLKNAYGFATDLDALNYSGNPVDTVHLLATAGIPLLHVVGDTDAVVPVSENTAIMEMRCEALDGLINVIHKPGVSHVHGLDDPAPIVDFILNMVHADEHIARLADGTTVSNGNLNVQFTGTTGQHYRIEFVQDLSTTNDWQMMEDIASLPLSPTNVPLPTTNSIGFYRIRWFPW
jgi:lysophospholipase L1-like esterase/pimeloyl-ACP methyl ester carboxylesterase